MVCHCENCDLRDVKEKIKKIRNHQRAVESQKMSLKSQMTTLLKEKKSFEEEKMILVRRQAELKRKKTERLNRLRLAATLGPTHE